MRFAAGASTWDRFVGVAELPARIAFLVGLAILARWFIFRVIDRLIATASDADKIAPHRRFGKRRPPVAAPDARLPQRQAQRAQALGSMFKSMTTGIIGVILIAMILSLLGFNLGPFLASAGIAGVALGFGAQSLVKDLVSGVFMLLEDQFGVGDFIDMGEASGTVEAVGLRITRLRDFDGTLWSVRNGEVLRVGNRSMGWAAIMVDAEIAYDEDTAAVQELLRRVGQDMTDDPEWRSKVFQAPQPVGVTNVTRWAVTVRMLGQCAPAERFAVDRELRRRIKLAFDAAEIRLPDHRFGPFPAGDQGTGA